MDNKFIFTFKNLKQYYEKALAGGYNIIRCVDYLDFKKQNVKIKTIVNRVDIDISLPKAKRLLKIFEELQIKASFFIRLHTDNYNPFSFENYRIIKEMIDRGHEIGYHSEIIEQAEIWKEDPVVSIKRDIEILNCMFNIKISGAASHGGRSGLNNLDFWNLHSPKEFGLLYEAYDKSSDYGLFGDSLYISDSSWYFWKCYFKGKLAEKDNRTFGEHLDDQNELIYLLIHPETYYDNHPYE